MLSIVITQSAFQGIWKEQNIIEKFERLECEPYLCFPDMHVICGRSFMLTPVIISITTVTTVTNNRMT